MHGGVRGVDPELGGGGRLTQLRGRKSRAVGLPEGGGLAQLRGCREHSWGIDRDLAGGGRLAQLRGCTERARSRSLAS